MSEQPKIDTNVSDNSDFPDNNVQSVKKKHGPMYYPQLFILHAILVVIIIWIMFGAVFGLTIMPNGDMSPRIDSGDLLLYYRFDKNVTAGDVVAFTKNDTKYIGRVVAVGGDTVDITDNEALVVNDNIIVEEYIYYTTPRYEGFVDYPVTLQNNECFILVDKRDGGEDSRYFGVVTKKDLLGTVITVVRRANL